MVENIDIGLAYIMIPILGIIYYLIATANYLLVVILGEPIKKLIGKRVDNSKEKFLYMVIPFFISSTVIFLTSTKLLSLIHINLTGSHNNVTSIYYFNGFTGYIIEMTCLALTRYFFTKDWTVIGRLKNKKTIFNFILCTTMFLILKFACDTLFNRFSPNWLTHPVITILATYLFLKWRNIEKDKKITTANTR
ncbi:MAG: hypothetical protein M0R02_08825 [Bacteroidales bacterium]|nr:hypothetical protein [Bacteroidales bacterium]